LCGGSASVRIAVRVRRKELLSETRLKLDAMVLRNHAAKAAAAVLAHVERERNLVRAQVEDVIYDVLIKSLTADAYDKAVRAAPEATPPVAVSSPSARASARRSPPKN
jgi:hypothetical protein